MSFMVWTTNRMVLFAWVFRLFFVSRRMTIEARKHHFGVEKRFKKQKNHLISFWSHDKKDKRVYVEK